MSDEHLAFSASQLRKHRRDAGLSRTELANRISASTDTVARYERGVMKPSDERLRVLADALHVEPSSLLAEAKRVDLTAHARALVAGWPELDDETRTELRAALRPVVAA